MIKARVEYTIKNLNREKIFKEIVQISSIKNVKYLSENIIFNVNKKDCKKVEKILTQKSATILNKRYLGLFSFLKKSILKPGIIIPIIIFLIFVFISNYFILNLEIQGINLIQKQEVLEVLDSCNITKIMPKSNINISKLQNQIQKIDKVSLVSVIIKGNTLIINIKEKVYNSEYEDKDSFLPIVSSHNGIITELTIIQGTPLVVVGQTIKVGQELVAPYVKDTNGKVLAVKPMADIKADVFYTTVTSVAETQVLYKDTGNSIKKREIKLFGNLIFSSNLENNFKLYRTETKEEYLGDNLFPIKYIITKYIEQEEIIVNDYYTKNKEQILEECKQKTRQLFESYAIIKDEYNSVTKTAGIVRISYTFVVTKTL